MSPKQAELPVLPDAEARRAIRDDLATTFFVEAAAGTGKTTALVGRIVSVLRSGAGELASVVAMTFTEKAAGEMKLRLRGEIERVRSDPQTAPAERARLDASLAQLEVARIGTIHSFCADLLHERPIEAGVDPLYEVTGEEEADGLLAEAFGGWFERILEDPPEGVQRVLRRRAAGPWAQTPREALLAAARTLIEHRDFPAAWRRDPFDRVAALGALQAQLEEVGALAALASERDDYLTRSLVEIERFVSEQRLQEAVRGRDPGAFEAALRTQARVRHWNWRGFKRTHFSPELTKASVLEQRDAAKAELDRVLAACEADLAPLLREELRDVVVAYEAAKARAGRLDFLDLLVRTRDLLQQNARVRGEQQERFTHFFVDEFQDTDPLQAEIVLLLAADDLGESDARRVRPAPGKLFLVGDPKQSIYRFRRADVAFYEELKRRLCSLGAQVLELNASFRSRPEIQQLVNASFEPAMRATAAEAGSSQANYFPLAPVRESPGDQPAVVALPVPRPYGDFGTVVNFKIDESLPDAVGAFVAWLVGESGWRVDERFRAADGSWEERSVPIAARHVCVLFRRMKRFRDDVTRPYVRALEARRVPHVLIGGRSFHEREEVLAMRNALHAIEWPDDALRVFATLRGPFFALADDALLAYRTRTGSLHPLAQRAAARANPEAAATALAALPDDERAVSDALELLAGLHARRNRRPAAETISELLAALRAHAGIAIWPTGEQALANCSRIVDMARRYEQRAGGSFRGFVEALEYQAEQGSAQDASVVEEGTEGVRMMTVHKAKGLEFPVVILADPTCKATSDRPMRHVDAGRGLFAETLCGCAPTELAEHAALEALHEREEAVRLAYVAATRARDLLVVPVVGDSDPAPDAFDAWLDNLNRAVYPPAAARRTPTGVAELAGVEAFGEDSVRDRPARARKRADASVRPGLHRPQAGAHSVLWWDPSALELDVRENVGLRQQKLLEADESGRATQRGAEAHERWREGRANALARGAVASLTPRGASELAESAPEEAVPAGTVEWVWVSEERTQRPHGKRFGTLVHAVLAEVPLSANRDEVAAVAALQARIVDASDDERAASIDTVCHALEHELFGRAAAADELRREAPITLSRSDGVLVEGAIDLAFREASGQSGTAPCWTVVDFKTDRDVSGRREVYEAQVRLYLEAVEAATGEPARGILLVV